MKDDWKNFQNVGICLLILAALTFVAYFIAPLAKPIADSGLDNSTQAIGLHFLFFIIGIALILALIYATRDDEAWEVDTQKPIFMVVGAVIVGVLMWLTNGLTFNIPTLSQVGFQPALVVAVMFGFLYGPVVGFMTGAGGYLLGSLFIGLVAPHWVVGYGIVGLFAGLPKLFEDERQSWDVAAIITGLGGLLAAGFFFANPGVTFSQPGASAPVGLSLFMGLSVLVGCALAIAVRFAFPNRPQWSVAAVWGAAGVVVGLLLAAIVEIWVSKVDFMKAAISQFIPQAGPALIAIAILVPLALALQAAAQESES